MITDEMIERVERGEGADRHLDALVENALGVARFRQEYPGPDFDLVRVDVRQLSSSLDAVASLIEAKLPGWVVSVVGQSDDRSWWAELRRGYQTSYDKVTLSHLKCASPARALLAAALRALKHQGDNS